MVLVLEFESRSGKILKLFARKRIPWVGTIRREPTTEGLKSSRDKNARHEPNRNGGGGGEEPAM